MGKEIIRTIRSIKKFHVAILDAKASYKANQKILYDVPDYNFYVNVKNDISIKLYKELSIDYKFNEISDPAYRSLHEGAQIIKIWSWRNMAMLRGDILIGMNNSAIAKWISENEFMQKNKAIVKWENCFIEISSPWWKDGERYKLVIATQEDLKAILKWLTELL